MKNIDRNFKFVIVGGGTSGWTSALYIKQHYPDADVTVVASSEIGIVGVGEGATPHTVQMLENININILKLLKHTGSTIKNGIRFTNWNGDGESYFHPFDQGQFDHSKIGDIDSGISLIDLEIIAKGNNLDEATLSALASNAHKATFVKDSRDPTGVREISKVALHFNAKLMAEYLQRIALSRNIKLIDNKIIDIITDEEGYITELTLENLPSVKCDFVFDCSGFHRLIIGKFYKSKWNSYEKYLPVKQAIPFFLEMKDGESMPPYTHGIGMKYGWMWKIPVQGRYGAGYAYDSNYITAEEAQKEVEEMLGHSIKPNKVISFNAGSYEKTWIKNCCAFGLSSGFMEPLEATSMWTNINSLWYFLNYTTGITHRDQTAIDKYNKEIVLGNWSVVEFLQWHYITKRTDTPFWKDFKTNNELTPLNKKMVEELEQSIPNQLFYRNFHDWWKPENWNYIATGLKHTKPEIADRMFKSLVQGHRSDLYKQEKKNYFNRLHNTVNTLIDHNELIRYAHEKVR
jgi:tryptophan halogenase